MFLDIGYIWLNCVCDLNGRIVFTLRKNYMLGGILADSVFAYTGLNDFKTFCALDTNDMFRVDVYRRLLTLICHKVLNVVKLLVHLEQVVS